VNHRSDIVARETTEPASPRCATLRIIDGLDWRVRGAAFHLVPGVHTGADKLTTTVLASTKSVDRYLAPPHRWLPSPADDIYMDTTARSRELGPGHAADHGKKDMEILETDRN